MTIRSALAGAMLLGTAAASTLVAQSVLIRGGATVRTTTTPGAKIAVPLIVDLSSAGGATFASLTVDVTFTPSALAFDSVQTTAFGTVTANTTAATDGIIGLAFFDPNGSSTTQTIATLWFTASNITGGSRVQFTPRVIGDANGNSILNLLRLQHLDVCVANGSGLFGDANGDAFINIIDAQQIARFSVGLTVLNLLSLTNQGDVNADGNVNIIDAQQIARFSVGLVASSRINTTALVSPPVASVIGSQATGTMYVGSAVQVFANAFDASSNSLNGCQPLIWTSNAPAVASVDSTGRVLALSAGSATITATAGGKSAQGTVAVIAAGPPATIVFAAGNQQWTYNSTFVPVAPTVVVRDAFGVAVPNVAITFTASGGTFNGGQPLQQVTDGNGEASAAGWVPPNTGTSMTMTAVAAGIISPAVATVNLILNPIGQSSCINDAWGTRCWGNGTRGQLGNGATSSSTLPVDVTAPVTGAFVSTTAQTSGDHFCGLDAAGKASCWGSNAGGQLGDGTRTDRTVPTAVVGNLTFVSLATGQAHTCGVSGGDVYCWGMNPHGQLGDSLRGSQYLTPTKVKSPAGLTFTQVTAATNFTCALTSTGAAYCWGNNTAGQLGDGTPGSSPHVIPFAVVGGLQFTRIAASFFNVCGLVSTGAAHCWGSNTASQLNSVGTPSVGSPVLIAGGHLFAEISVGLNRACGVKTSPDNSTWCWGSNANGALGDGSLLDRSMPTALPVTLGRIVHGGFNGTGHACGVAPGGEETYCWGSNSSGSLGDGTTTNRIVPTLVPRNGAPQQTPLAIETQSIAMVGQSGPTGVALAIPPAVFVRDATGAPVSNVTVTWTILSGGGSVVNTTSITDALGIAVSGGWTLGGVVGLQTMQATVGGVVVNGTPTATPLRNTFTAFGTSAPAFAVKLSGDSMVVFTSNSGSPFVPQIVKVTDASNAPLPNVAVTFSLGANSGTITNSLANYVALTDQSGEATLPAGAWIGNALLTPASTLSASVAGMATPLVFTLFRANTNFGGVSCELTNAGAAMCAGLNTFGTVGDGTFTNRTTFVPVSGNLVFTQLAEGTSMTKCGLVGTSAFCWGSNSLGQVGDGTQVDRNAPTPVSGGLAFAQLASMGGTTCGITTTQQLFCWGWTGDAGWNEGQAMRGRVHLVPTLVNTNGLTFTKVTVGDNGFCGLTPSGAIHCLGRSTLNGDGTTIQKSTFSQWSGGPYIDVQAGNTNACALDTNGLAYCVGSNQGGALGAGLGIATVGAATPLQVLGGITFASIHSGNFRACGRRANGDVWCWGLSPGTGLIVPVSADRPVQIPGFKTTTLRAETFRNTCGKVASGALFCWGSNAGGTDIVGDGTTITRQSPVAVLNWPDGPAAGVAVSMYPNVSSYTSTAGLAVTPLPSVIVKDRLGAVVPGVTVTFSASPGNGTVTSGSVVTDVAGVATVGSWTTSATPGLNRLDISAPGVPPAAIGANTIPAAGSISIVGGNNQFLPDFHTQAAPLTVLVVDATNTPINGATVFFSVSAASTTVVGGQVVTALTNAQGIATFQTWFVPTALGTYTAQATTGNLATLSFTARRLAWQSNGVNNPVAATCRLSVSSAAFCWGASTSGAIGNGSNSSVLVPTAVSSPSVFTSIAESAFGFHQCGLVSGGQAFCWGNNDAGQLGDGTQVSTNAPVAVTGGITFSKVFTGALNSCGLATSGSLFCWGFGGFSLRGDGTISTIALVPTLVNTAGRTFTTITIGGRMICALDAANQAFCWGEGGLGQLGSGNISSAQTPVAVPTSLRFTKLTAGHDFVCGLTTTSRVACWGFNTSGQVGIGTSTNVLSATDNGLSSIVDVRATEQAACARSLTAIFCWGSNAGGQVGDGGAASGRLSPVQIGKGISPASFQSFSRTMACASTTAQLYCWGSSTGGGVGDGSGVTRATPTAIRWVDALASDPAMIAAVTPVSSPISTSSPNTVTAVVRNHLGSPLAGVSVDFVVTSGGGSASPVTVATDGSGNASTSWTTANTGTIEARLVSLPTIAFTGTAIAAGSISVSGVTSNGSPVNLTNATGQLDVSLNTNGGGTTRIAVSTSCGSSAISGPDLVLVSQTAPSGGARTLSFNSAGTSPGTNLPFVLNGAKCIKAGFTPTGGTVGGANDVSASPVTLTLNNNSFFRITASSFSGFGANANGGGALNGLRFDRGDFTVTMAYVNYLSAAVAAASLSLKGSSVQATQSANATSPAGSAQTFTMTLSASTQTSQYQTTLSGGDTLKITALLNAAGGSVAVPDPIVYPLAVNPNTTVNPSASAFTLRIDNASPLAPTFTTPSGALNVGATGAPCGAGNGLPCTNFLNTGFAFANATTPAVVGDASANFTTTVNYGFRLNDGGFVPLSGGTSTSEATCGTSVNPSTGVVSFPAAFTFQATSSGISPTSSPFTPNTYRLRRFELDALGNVRCTDLPNPFGVDNDQPTTTTLDALANNSTINPNSAVSFSFTDPSSGFITNHQVEITDSLNFTTCVNPTGSSVTIAASGANGCLARTTGNGVVINPGNTQGYYRVVARAVDQADNRSAASARSFLFDQTPPSVGGIAIPQVLTGGGNPVFLTSLSDNVDLKGAQLDVTYSSLTSAYAPVGATGSGIVIVYDTLNKSSPFTNTFDANRQFAISYNAFAPGFVTQVIPTDASGNNQGNSAITPADSGEAKAVSIRAVDAANLVSVASVAQIPDINITSGAPFSTSAFSTFIVTNGSGTLSNNTAGTGTQSIGVIADATLNSASANSAPAPFGAVCFFYQQSANIGGSFGQPWIPVGAWVNAGCVFSPAVIDVAGASRTFRYQFALNPSASLGTSGPLKLIAIGVRAGTGVGIVTPINSSTSLTP